MGIVYSIIVVLKAKNVNIYIIMKTEGHAMYVAPSLL